MIHTRMLAAIGVALVLVGLQTPASARSPNILIFLADDLGYADLGFQGCRDIPTPNNWNSELAARRLARTFPLKSVDRLIPMIST